MTGRLGRSAVLCLALFWASPLVGQEIVLDSFSGLGARAMGMGGAYLALSDDFAGLFWNPAGLARVSQGEVYTAFSHERFENEARFFGSASRTEFSSTRLNALGAVYPYPVYRGSLVLAGGYGRIGSFDSGLTIDGYDPVAAFDKSGFSEDSGALGVFSFGAAVDVAPRVSVGLSLQVLQGNNRFTQELTLQDTQDAHADTVRLYQRVASNDQYTAWRLKAGLLYVHASGLRLGATVSSPMTLEVQSDLVDEFEDEFEDRTESYPPERFEDRYKLKLPFEFGLGVAWKRNGLALAGDVQYGDLQQVTYQDRPAVIAPPVESFRNEYRNTFRYHLGAEYQLPGNRVALRAGYYRDPIRYLGGGNVPDIRVEEDRNVFTVGLGGQLEEAVVLDVAAVFGGFRRIEGNREDHVTQVRVFAGVGYRFKTD